jgi:protein O-mannosyl-transferase
MSTVISSAPREPGPQLSVAAGGLRGWLPLLLLLGLVLVAFSGVVACRFVYYDDQVFIQDNPKLQLGISWAGLHWALVSAYSESAAQANSTNIAHWHPLVWLSFLLDYRLYGLAAWGYHLTNLIWHVGSTLALFIALRRLTGTTWRSFFVAALFAVHPINVEPVAWVAERKGVVSTFFWMLTVWAYAWYAERPSWARYLVVALSLVLGLQAKQMLVTLPCVLLLLDFWPLRRWQVTSWQRLVGEKIPLLALALAFAAIPLLSSISNMADERAPLPWFLRLGNAGQSYVGYLQQALWPTGFAVFYPYTEPVLWKVAAAVLVLGVLTALALAQARQRGYFVVGWLWYLGTLVPVSGLVLQIGDSAHADRYAYIPLIGIYLAVTWGTAEFARWLHAERPAVLMASGVLAALVFVSRGQVHVWHDRQALWQHCLQTTGSSATAHYNLGAALYSDKRAAEEQFRASIAGDATYYPSQLFLGLILLDAGNCPEAIEHLRMALPLIPRGDPWVSVAHYHLGLALLRSGERAHAAFHFMACLQEKPDDELAHANLGIILLEQGDRLGAMEHLQTAIRLQPQLAIAHYQLGIAYLGQDDPAAAIAPLRQACVLKPEAAEIHRDLAFAAQCLNHVEEARAEYQQSLRLDSSWPESVRRTAWELAAKEDQAATREALRLARTLVGAREKHEPADLDVLGAAYAATGQFSAAATAAQQALLGYQARGQAELAKKVEQRLRSYQRGERAELQAPCGVSTTGATASP